MDVITCRPVWQLIVVCWSHDCWCTTICMSNLHQKTCEVNIYTELSHIYPESFQVIHGRCAATNDLPDISSTIMTLHRPLPWKGNEMEPWIKLQQQQITNERCDFRKTKIIISAYISPGIQVWRRYCTEILAISSLNQKGQIHVRDMYMNSDTAQEINLHPKQRRRRGQQTGHWPAVRRRQDRLFLLGLPARSGALP